MFFCEKKSWRKFHSFRCPRCTSILIYIYIYLYFFKLYIYIPWKSKDYFLNGFSVKTIVLVGIYNQQFKGTILFMVLDFQGIYIYIFNICINMYKYVLDKSYHPSARLRAKIQSQQQKTSNHNHI